MHQRLSSLSWILVLGITLVSLTACRSEFMEKMGWGSFGYNKGYSPEQPIPFDHALHAGTHQIQCQYCHNQVERSGASNIPSLSTCMNCHLVVKTDSPLIQQLREAYDSGKSIQWVKVHMLPDHAKFNHSAHINKGVSCQTCHGPIETMKQVYQYSDLSMGWCVNCHRQPENNAPINCSTCHH
jgi:hypothetical protein